MRNVMIFSGGSYPGVEIYFSLKDSVVFHPILASSYSDHSKFITDDYLDNLPFTYEENFVEKLNVILREHNIEFIIPTHDTIAMVLAENADKLLATVVCSDKITAEICRFKSKTYTALEKYDFIPMQFKRYEDILEYPVFIKPDDGQGSVGARIVDTKEELGDAFNTDNFIVCEYMPGDEYTIDCFTNRKGELIFANPRKRARIQYGISARAESVDDEFEFLKIANIINAELNFRGYWFIQLKRDKKGKLKLLELSTRFSGTFNHSQGYGINLPLLAVSDFAGNDVSVTKNNYKVFSDKTFIDRYILDYSYSRVYIDYDDTITEKHGLGINPLIIAYLYQCKNLGKKIILITRHTASKNNGLSEDFEKKCISKRLFDEIIELSPDDEKYMYMDNNMPSVFIDNSYTERKKVYENLKIPVFDVTHVACLYDWRK